MNDYSLKDILLAIGGSAGFIVAMVTAFNYVSGRVDAFRTRRKANLALEISQAADVRGLDAKERQDLVDNLWKIIEQERVENEALRTEISELENDEKLSRPTVTRIYRIIRQMRHELDQINVMMMSEEQTAIFMKRWNAVKTGCDSLEDLLAGDEPKEIISA